MRTNYVLIDYESLQPELLSALNLPHFRVIVLVGANQSKVPVEFAALLQPLGDRARYIRISGSGRNALDFHICFYMGELLAQDLDAYFHVISADTGYDPLLQHLRVRKVFAKRYKSIADIPHVAAATTKSLPTKVEFVRTSLFGRLHGRPATVKTLGSSIVSMFSAGLDDEQRDAIISELEKSGLISIAGTKISYNEVG